MQTNKALFVSCEIYVRLEGCQSYLVSRHPEFRKLADHTELTEITAAWRMHQVVHVIRLQVAEIRVTEVVECSKETILVFDSRTSSLQ